MERVEKHRPNLPWYRLQIRARQFFNRVPLQDQQKIYVLTLLIGAVCGLAAVLFHLLLDYFQDQFIYRAASIPHWWLSRLWCCETAEHSLFDDTTLRSRQFRSARPVYRRRSSCFLHERPQLPTLAPIGGALPWLWFSSRADVNGMWKRSKGGNEVLICFHLLFAGHSREAWPDIRASALRSGSAGLLSASFAESLQIEVGQPRATR